MLKEVIARLFPQINDSLPSFAAGVIPLPSISDIARRDRAKRPFLHVEDLTPALGLALASFLKNFSCGQLLERLSRCFPPSISLRNSISLPMIRRSVGPFLKVTEVTQTLKPSFGDSKSTICLGNRGLHRLFRHCWR